MEQPFDSERDYEYIYKEFLEKKQLEKDLNTKIPADETLFKELLDRTSHNTTKVKNEIWDRVKLMYPD